MHSPPAKFCISILPRSENELFELLRVNQNTDLLEIRCDYLVGRINLQQVRRHYPEPLIITVRNQSEGGFWKGPESDRITFFKQALDAGMNYIDVEWLHSDELFRNLRFPATTELIISHHTAETDSSRLQSLFREMLKTPADIYKFIYTVDDLNGNLHLPDLIRIPQQKKVRYIIHGMGEAGLISRIIGSMLGNEWTYVAGANADATAEGQPDIHTLKDIYFLQERSADTRLTGLVGYPVRQSSGWKLHNCLVHRAREIYKQKVTDYIYLNFPVQNLENFWRKWEPSLYGLSITIPHKQNFISLLDQPGRTVLLSGVCNTAVKKNGIWYGFNADMLAIYELLKPHHRKLTGGVLIYGTGATTRSAVAAVRELNINEIYICGRNRAKGRQIAEEFHLQFVDEDNLPSVRPAVIIQTTPVGMFPDTDAMPPLESFLSEAELVFDVIFNPAETELLKTARKYGCEIISGEQMYLLQALRQFSLLSGVSIDHNILVEEWHRLKDNS